MPDQTWPGVVEHPLNNARGFIFIAAVGFEHGTLPFVGHGLGFPGEIGEVFRLAITAFQRVCKNIDVFELSAAGVVPPKIINGPQFIFRKKRFQSFDWRNGGARTSLGVENVRAASLWIQSPLIWRK